MDRSQSQTSRAVRPIVTPALKTDMSTATLRTTDETVAEIREMNP
jgi:hypothetical protein